MFAVESQAAVRSVPVLPLSTTLGPVRIGITDPDTALAIWRDVVGLDVVAQTPQMLSLGIGGAVLIELVRDAVRPVVPNTTGLYHVAIHVPTRRDFAAMAARALERRVRISPTDHLVSEAIYLWDADGNGIEITFETPWRGRPGGPEEGAYAIATDGRPHSGREPIDLRGLLAELAAGPIPDRMPQGTRIGHVHFHVTDLHAAMRFYRDGLGFGGLFIMAAWGMGDVALDYMPHAIAFNIWAGPNARPAPAGAAGLRHFTIVLPDARALETVRDRLSAIGAAVTPIDGGFEARDPAQNRVRLVARA